MTDNNLPSKILIVDDDPTVAQGLEEPLSRNKIALTKAINLDSALYYFNTQRFDVVLVELEFGPLPGLALIQKWRRHEVEEKRNTGFIVITGLQRGMEDEALLRELGEMEFLLKPFTLLQLLPYLNRAYMRKHSNAKVEEVRNTAFRLYETTKDVEKAASLIKKNFQELGTKGVRMLGDLYETAEKYEPALPLVSGLLEQTPTDISLMNTKGRLLLKLGRHDEAQAEMEKADKEAPGNIERINNMVMMYLKMNLPEASVSKMRDLLKLNPESPDLKFDMFSKLHEYGFSEHATEFCRETTGPQEVVRHYNNKGVALSKGGKLDEAITEYERALKYYPTFKENYRIYFNIALAHILKKTPESLELAIKALEKCMEMAPDFEKGKKTLETLKERMKKAQIL